MFCVSPKAGRDGRLARVIRFACHVCSCHVALSLGAPTVAAVTGQRITERVVRALKPRSRGEAERPAAARSGNGEPGVDGRVGPRYGRFGMVTGPTVVL